MKSNVVLSTSQINVSGYPGSVHVTPVTVTNAGTYGAHLYGDAWGFLGGPVSNIVLTNMSVDKAGIAGLHFSGPAEDVIGNVNVTNTPKDCTLDNGWSAGTITQSPGSVLTVNGAKLDQGNAAARCR